MSEFSLIEDIRALFESIPKNNFEGIGDDCAVLPIGNNEALLFTSDMLNEGIHFLPERVSAHDIGYKAVMVNISDIVVAVITIDAKPTTIYANPLLSCRGGWT